MITVLLSGGLGNQMFQYAAGKALAERLSVPLRLDLFYFTKKTKATRRLFGLEVFEAGAHIINNMSLRSKLFVRYKPFFMKHKNARNFLKIFADANALFYERSFEQLTDHTILAGYFQNEVYFKAVEPVIRADFRFKKPLTANNARIAGKMADVQSVAIHIRRGDYVSNPANSLVVCDTGYYHRAIASIAQKQSAPHFFVFSDDMEWVKANIRFEEHPCTFIDWNTGADSYIDMQLMSLCRHNIISNSSFSWWGAWLNNHPQKTVIAPKRWFKNSFYDNYAEYIPMEWLRV